MYVSASGVAGEEISQLAFKTPETLIIGSHGPRARRGEDGFLPSAKNLYLTDKTMLESIAWHKDGASYGRILVDSKIVTMIFD